VANDLLFQHEIKQMVRTAYRDVTTGGGAVAELVYRKEDIEDVPRGSLDWALGVGDPVRHAELRAGETVLDVGSGGGIDSILAARRVGPGGHVLGLDILGSMCERAERHARQAGVGGWTAFVTGEMERIPLPDDAVDVVISNGVINLSARKSRVFAEIRRVLRPGGRMCVADLVVDDELPSEILRNDAAWAG
jgi:arsenite methyltransferase